MIRVVLDTNILISALLQPQGLPARTFVMVLAGTTAQLCVSGDVYAEYEEVIRRPKFNRSEMIIDHALRAIRQNGSHALGLDPNDILALSGRGQVFIECGEFSRALQDLDCALEGLEQIQNVPSDWKTSAKAYVLNGRAAAYAGLGEFDRACQYFDQSMALCPKNAWVYFNQAEAYEKRGDMKHAIANYKLSIAMKEPRLNVLKRKYAETKLSTLHE